MNMKQCDVFEVAVKPFVESYVSRVVVRRPFIGDGPHGGLHVEVVCCVRDAVGGGGEVSGEEDCAMGGMAFRGP
jgi:hypothetical protein